MSLKDGQSQVFDSRTLEAFSYWFAGDSVRLRLHAAPGSRGRPFFSITSVGECREGIHGPQDFCGISDTRVPSADRFVARMRFRHSGKNWVCTAFLMGRVNCLSSAGHCFHEQRDCPRCRVQRPTVRATRAVSLRRRFRVSTALLHNAGAIPEGATTGPVFLTRANTVTKQHAADAQGGYYRFSRDYQSTWRVTGFGKDATPLTRNHTQQTAVGLYKALSGSRLDYRIDTQGGVSGGPVLNRTGFVTAIHTNGGCSRFGGANSGTLISHQPYASARVLTCNHADLRVESLKPSSTTMHTSRTYIVQIVIKNHGNVASAACTSRIVISANDLISTSDPVLASIPTPALAVGQSYTTSRSFRMPASAPSGTCYLGGYADSGAVVTELDNTNNTRALRITCVRDLRPNLRISQLSSSAATLTPNQVFAITSRTVNDSVVVAPASATGLYLSDNSTISVRDSLLGSYSVPQLTTNAGFTQSKSVRAPSKLPHGTCFVGAYADFQKLVPEFDERNTRSIAVTCRDLRPDLVVSSVGVTPGSNWTAGSTIGVTVKTSNVGTWTAGASTTSIHLSQNQAISSSDDCLGSMRVPTLPSGQSYTQTVQVLLSRCYATSSRPHYVGALADARLEWSEQDESNNGRHYWQSRPVAGHSGAGRWLDFESPRIWNQTPSYLGAETARIARWDASRGGRGRICITARQDAGRLAVILLSGNSQFVMDGWATVSLAVPLFTPLAVPIPASGQAFTSFRLPSFVSRGVLGAHTHSLWFNLTPSFSFAGMGSNTLTNYIYP